ncbi:MAG: MmgE/PrpD family protein [Chloroflexi bacterium]|nr:MmgE/PrpD family protein [Chloroflexota bacterium]
MSATGELASFVCHLDASGLPDAVLRQASRCVLDLVGVAIAGTRQPMAEISARFGYEQFAPGNNAVIGSSQRLSATGAAWINGTYASALDMDDGNRLAMGHPGANIIPAALAMAERTGARGREFLAALVAGYEAAVRASAARVPWYKEQLYSTGIWGVFGAAAAAGKLLGFDAATLQSALGIAGSHGPFPPGGLQANHAMVKEVIAWSGMTGLAAALLAQGGFIGPPDLMDYSGRWDPKALAEGLGEHYAILDTYFKPYAVCRWAHASVDAVLGLKKRYCLRVEDIVKIQVESFFQVTHLANYMPANTIAAQYSLPFALAAALLYDQIMPEQVSETTIRDPRLLGLARKVEVAVDADLNAQFPAKTIARVTVQTTRGTQQLTVEYPRGNPENPLSDAELETKFRMLTEDIIGSERSEKLRAAIQALPDAPNVSVLTRLLAG